MEERGESVEALNVLVVRDRLREYNSRIANAIRRFTDGESDFTQMTKECDRIRDWYHSIGTYRSRALADPRSYQHKDRNG